MDDHRVNINKGGGFFGGVLYRVVCACGWRALATTPETAEAYAKDHLAQMQEAA